MKLNVWKWQFILLFFLCPLTVNSQTYTTWQGLEPDKLASSWLIKRFIDQDAEFQMIPKGSMVENGIPFDVPSAQFKRSHTQSTFEKILQDHGINDEQLIYIGQIIHDIEINTWDIKKIKQTSVIESTLREIIDSEEDEQEVILRAMQVFDKIYKEKTQ